MCRDLARSNVLFGRSRYAKDTARALDVCGRAVRKQKEVVGDERVLVLDRLFLRNPNMNQTNRYCGGATDYGSRFQASQQRSQERSRYEYGSDTGYQEKSGAEQQPPYATPECSSKSPVLHALTGRVIANCPFLIVIVFADD